MIEAFWNGPNNKWENCWSLTTQSFRYFTLFFKFSSLCIHFSLGMNSNTNPSRIHYKIKNYLQSDYGQYNKNRMYTISALSSWWMLFMSTCQGHSLCPLVFLMIYFTSIRPYPLRIQLWHDQNPMYICISIYTTLTGSTVSPVQQKMWLLRKTSF